MTMQTPTVERDPGISGIFRTLPLSSSLTFESATTLRTVLKQATQYACLSRPEREVCMQMVDDLDELLARFAIAETRGPDGHVPERNPR
jgi:hypothetical protein